jgi:rsbT co-antagonist protein RsbR
MIPLVGILDSARAKQLTESILNYITNTKTEVVILSIEGIATIDAETANHILRTVNAVKLMGSEVIVTGIRPDVATNLVSLGIDLSSIVTRSTLREGLDCALAKRGLKATESL